MKFFDIILKWWQGNATKPKRRRYHYRYMDGPFMPVKYLTIHASNQEEADRIFCQKMRILHKIDEKNQTVCMRIKSPWT